MIVSHSSVVDVTSTADSQDDESVLQADDDTFLDGEDDVTDEDVLLATKDAER